MPAIPGGLLDPRLLFAAAVMASMRSLSESTAGSETMEVAALAESIWCCKAVADKKLLASRRESRRRRESRTCQAESWWRESRAEAEVSCDSVSPAIFDESTAWAKESGEGGFAGGWAIAVRQTAQHINTSISSLLINNRGISLKMHKTRIYCIK